MSYHSQQNPESHWDISNAESPLDVETLDLVPFLEKGKGIYQKNKKMSSLQEKEWTNI